MPKQFVCAGGFSGLASLSTTNVKLPSTRSLHVTQSGNCYGLNDPLLPMPKFFYVYILQTENGQHHYVGLTEDLRERLQEHTCGRSPHTSKYGPWRLKTYLAFSNQGAAVEFEKYLKSGSGRAFSKKRL